MKKLGITYGYSIDLEAPLGVQVVTTDGTTPLRPNDWVVALAATTDEIQTFPDLPFLLKGLALEEITTALQNAVVLGVIRPPETWTGEGGGVSSWSEVAVAYCDGEWAEMPLPRGVLPHPR